MEIPLEFMRGHSLTLLSAIEKTLLQSGCTHGAVGEPPLTLTLQMMSDVKSMGGRGAQKPHATCALHLTFMLVKVFKSKEDFHQDG
jgi:hypothetical protein